MRDIWKEFSLFVHGAVLPTLMSTEHILFLFIQKATDPADDLYFYMTAHQLGLPVGLAVDSLKPCINASLETLVKNCSVYFSCPMSSPV